MKQRSLSLLLALSMIFSMLSMATVSVSAAGTAPTLLAYQTELNRSVVVDGTIKEAEWFVDSPVGASGHIGALCDTIAVYLALETAATSASFNIGGKQIDAVLGAAPTVSVGQIAAGDGVYEIAIPLSDLGIEFEKGKTLPMTAVLGAETASFTLDLGSEALVKVNFGRTGDALGFAGLDRNMMSSLFPDNQTYCEPNGDIILKYDNSVDHRGNRFIYATASPFSQFSEDGWALSFNADFNSLPTPDPEATRNPGNLGFFTLFCNGSLRTDFGFWADENGQVMCSVRLPSTVATYDNSTWGTGITMGTEEAKDVRIRLLGNAAGDVTVYLNGQVLGTAYGAIFANTTAGQLRFYASVLNCLPERSVVDVELHDLMLREYAVGEITEKAVEDVLDYKAASGSGLADATAYLDAAGIVHDGRVRDNQWYLPLVSAYKVGSDAPAARSGFLWDSDNLYVGIQTFSKSDMLSAQLSVNGKSVTADLLNCTAPAGTLIGDFQQYEWAIPLSYFGLTSPVDQTVKYSLTLKSTTGTSGTHGMLTFSNKVVVSGENATDITTHNNWVDNKIHSGVYQGKDFFHFTMDSFTGDEIPQYHVAPVDFKGNGGYEMIFDLTINDLPYYTATRGWRGWCIEIREGNRVTQGSIRQTRFNLRSDGGENVIMDVLMEHEGTTYTALPTGVKIGERAVFKMVVDDDMIPHMYVNDKYVCSFPDLDARVWFPLNDANPVPRLMIQAVNHGRAKSNDGKIHVVDVEMNDFLWVTTADNALSTAVLESVTEELVLAGNDPAALKGKLNLPAKIAAPGKTATYPVTWTVADAATGAKLDCIDVASGQVLSTGKAATVALTATVSADAPASKTFTFKVPGGADNKVAFIEHDADPRVGVAADFDRDAFVWFDGNLNSLVYDQGSAKPFNRITLYDSDDVSRSANNHFGVFISNDNKTYTKVLGWQLHQEGNAYTLYNLDETARYIKVHSYQDNLEGSFNGSVEHVFAWRPSFYNTIQSSMTVSYETDLLGAKGGFAHAVSFDAQNETDKELTDAPVYITLDELGAKAGEYRADLADFRFVNGDLLLAHWSDGKDGFYVRVPSIPAKGFAKLTAYWGNASAKDISDGEATFEVRYGNVTCHNLTRESEGDDYSETALGLPDRDSIGYDARTFTFPNGRIIIHGTHRQTYGYYAISDDGGRTFSEPKRWYEPTPEDTAKYGGYTLGGAGGYMWDPNINRLWIYCTYASYNGSDMSKSNGRLCLFYTDDFGETFSTADRRYMTIQGATPVAENDIIFQNAKNRPYIVSYTEGITLQGCDYEGPNVDYVITHGMQINNKSQFGVAAIYSMDGGETWWHSETVLTMDNIPAGLEYGLSESALTQLDDGTLYLVCRAQRDDNYNFYQAWSDDFGKTWRDVGPSPVISSNTHPNFYRYNDAHLLMWAGHNSLGGNARQRLPLTVGISYDNCQSYDRFVNLTHGTSLDSIRDLVRRISQPGMSISPDGTEAFVGWSNLRGMLYYNGTGQTHLRTAEGFLVEEFDQMLLKNKGAYDDFETTYLQSEGWLTDMGQNATVSTEQAATGDRSMKLSDDGLFAATSVRPIVSTHRGNIGASVYVPSGNTTDFVMELKAAYNYTYLRHTFTGFGVMPNGDVFTVHDTGKEVVAKVDLNTWNDFAISFDLDSGEKGTLYLNGKEIAKLDLMDKGNEVSAIVFMVPEKDYNNPGSVMYVDNFFVTEANLTRGVVRNNFADVAEDAWYAKAVDFALDNRIMGGYNATSFGPNDSLSRAMVVQVLYNKEGQPFIAGSGKKFPDVAAGQWYNNAISWASQNGVVGGYGDGRFGPNDNVTLEQAAVILWNYSGNPAAEGSLDAIGNHSDWAANALRWCAAEGLLEGIPFDAVTGAASRAQTAHLLMNYLNK